MYNESGDIMHIKIESNSNCSQSHEFFFKELGQAEPLQGILVGEEGKETECDVVGVEPGGRWVQAWAVKISDSGDGVAFMIIGGVWGIRIRPQRFRGQTWDLADQDQWGEPYKIYGKKEDILFGTSY